MRKFRVREVIGVQRITVFMSQPRSILFNVCLVHLRLTEKYKVWQVFEQSFIQNILMWFNTFNIPCKGS